MLFVLSGSGSIDAEPIAAESSAHLADDEAGTLVAGEGIDLLMVRLPSIVSRGELLNSAA